MNGAVILFLTCVLLFSVSAVDAEPIKEKIAKHEKPEPVKRIKQVFDINDIEKGSKITSTSINFPLLTNIGDECVIILNEKGLNKIEISDHFTCSGTNQVQLNIKGNHALQTKLNTNKFNVDIKSLNTNSLIGIVSETITLDVNYQSPTYYAKIENNIVTDVITADQEFISSQQGQWVELQKGQRCGIGYSYDLIIDTCTPKQPYQSWIFVNGNWQAPVPEPSDGNRHVWNEQTKSWVIVS